MDANVSHFLLSQNRTLNRFSSNYFSLFWRPHRTQNVLVLGFKSQVVYHRTKKNQLLTVSTIAIEVICFRHIWEMKECQSLQIMSRISPLPPPPLSQRVFALLVCGASPWIGPFVPICRWLFPHSYCAPKPPANGKARRIVRANCQKEGRMLISTHLVTKSNFYND